MALIAFLLPLLLHGGGESFLFSGLRWRLLVSSLLVWWANAAVVAMGILYLKRDRVRVAGGIFVAVALIVAIGIGGLVLQIAPHFSNWRADVVLVLEAIECGLLALAAARAIGAHKA